MIVEAGNGMIGFGALGAIVGLAFALLRPGRVLIVDKAPPSAETVVFGIGSLLICRKSTLQTLIDA